jgi:hypothetical protein
VSIFGKLGRFVTGLVTRALKLAALSMMLVALIFVLDATLSPDKAERPQE